MDPYFQVTIFPKEEFEEPNVLIGDGGQGNVYQVNRKGTTEKNAIKILKQFHFQSEFENFFREIQIFAQLKYPTILSLLGITIESPYYIVT